MDMQEIEVNINKNGKISLSLQGVKGDTCLEITQELEALLGNDLLERKFKHEYYDPPTQQNTSKFTHTNKQ